MRNLPSWSILLPVLMASVASAQGHEPQSRNLALPDGPDQIAPPIYVAGTVVTVLRFEQSVDPARTKMAGWEGRFEPLIAAGKTVVLVPLHDLTPEDRVPLVVTLMDGTQVPLTVTAETDKVDRQVNLYRGRESDLYLRAALDDSLWRERLFRHENERYEKEEASPDHALAALLANEAVKQTPFRRIRRWAFKDVDTEIDVTVYAGKSKAAVLFRITNHAARAWNLREARLTSGSDADKAVAEVRQCAVRMLPRSIAPGASGVVAIVADKSAFVSEKGLETLAIQIIRQDGLVQALVMLDPALARE